MACALNSSKYVPTRNNRLNKPTVKHTHVYFSHLITAAGTRFSYFSAQLNFFTSSETRVTDHFYGTYKQPQCFVNYI